MKGEVISYGKQGDPVVRPEDGGKLTVLTQYDTKPQLGETIDYRVTVQGKRVNRGVLQVPEGRIADTKHPLDAQLIGIQSLWDESFAQHMTPKSNADFLASLQEIKNAYSRGDFKTAVREANENYRWAAEGREWAELTRPGFSYFPLSRQLQTLEATIKSMANQTSP